MRSASRGRCGLAVLARVGAVLLFIGVSFTLVGCSGSAKSEANASASVAPPNAPTAEPTFNSEALGAVKTLPSAAPKAVAVRHTPEPEEFEPPPSVTRKEVEAYIEEAESLLMRAEAYARAAGNGLSDDGWYDEDRAFQARGDALSRRITLRLARTQQTGDTTWDGIAFDISHNIGQAESFLFASVQSAIAMCNGHDANANLRVARADIYEARRDFDKMARDPEDWSPPEIEETGGDECRR